jgi:uncharacterized tellurite resistance protein B-like protein
MELHELSADERVALVALLEMVVDSDTALSDGEVDRVDEIIAAVGEERYREAVDAVERRLRDEAALKTFLKTITRQDARECIYGTVLEAALPDSVNNLESAVLDWLAREWGVSVRIDPDTGPR